MEILYRRQRATVEEIRSELPTAPSPSSVRKLLEILMERGKVTREYDGPRFVYFPAASPEEASRSALHDVVETFFGGSRGATIAALLSDDDKGPTGRRLRETLPASGGCPRWEGGAMIDLFSQGSPGWAVSILAKATVLMAAGALLWVCLRKATAARRHALLTCVVVGLLVLPVASLLLPSWVIHTEAESVMSRAGQLRDSFAAGAFRPSALQPDASGTSSANASRGAASAFSAFTLSALPGGIYLAGVVIVLLRALIGEVRFRRVSRGRAATSEEWLRYFSEAKSIAGPEREVILQRGDRSRGPVTWGILKPVILIPASADEWTPHRWRSVLLHELGPHPAPGRSRQLTLPARDRDVLVPSRGVVDLAESPLRERARLVTMCWRPASARCPMPKTFSRSRAA